MLSHLLNFSSASLKESESSGMSEGRKTVLSGDGAPAPLCVVMVSYFTGEILFTAMEAVLREEVVARLVLVDNGNPPGVQKRLRETAASDPRIELITGQGNVGFARGCNLGAEKARQPLLLLLNPDCVPVGGEIRELVDAARGLTGDWLLGPRLMGGDGREQAGSRRNALTPATLVAEGTGIYRLRPGCRRFNLHQEPLPEEMTEVAVISGACMLMPLESYLRMGGMDEGYFLHVEDIDFCLRFRQAGGKVWFCPQVELAHRKGSSEAPSRMVERHKMQGFLRYFRQHFFDDTPFPLRALTVSLVWLKYLGSCAASLAPAWRQRQSPSSKD